MARTAMVRARIEPMLKRRAEGILDKIGITSTEFIRMAYAQVIAFKGVPFPARIPNAETRAALEEANRGGGEVFTDLDALWKDLGIKPSRR